MARRAASTTSALYSWPRSFAASRAAGRGRLVRLTSCPSSSDSAIVEFGHRVQRRPVEFSRGGLAGLMASSEACARCDEPPGPFGDGPSSSVAAILAPFAGRHATREGRETLDLEAFIEGPVAREYGVSQGAAKAVGALAADASSALLDMLFDDRPALLLQIKEAKLPEVRCRRNKKSCSNKELLHFRPACLPARDARTSQAALTMPFARVARALPLPQGLHGGLLHVLFHHGDRFFELLTRVRSTRAALTAYADARTLRARADGTARRKPGVHDHVHGEYASDSESDEDDEPPPSLDEGGGSDEDEDANEGDGAHDGGADDGGGCGADDGGGGRVPLPPRKQGTADKSAEVDGGGGGRKWASPSRGNGPPPTVTEFLQLSDCTSKE